MSHESQAGGDTQALLRLFRLIWPGALGAQAVYLAAKFRIPELLAGGPMRSDEIAQATGTNRRALHRLLRVLTAIGVLAQDEDEHFRNTDLGEALRSDYAHNHALFLAAPYAFRSLAGLEETLVTGRPSFETIEGKKFYQFLAENPEASTAYHAAVNASSAKVAAGVLSAYDFSGVRRLVDVGGGQGHFLRELLLGCPELSAVLVDFPDVVAAADTWRTGDLAQRCEIVAGDCTEWVPEGGDLYLLKGVLVDTSDADALKILRNCRRAIRPDGRLLVLDTIYSPKSRSQEVLLDILMMSLIEGCDRSESEYRSLLQEAGFEWTRTIETPWLSILESQPA
jgi:O-methyltransferase domain/Dimerisation domain